jgi:hypothetical protein
MTDPTLAALLADPDPEARLIAADRAEELGDELLGAWLRLEAIVGENHRSYAFVGNATFTIQTEPGGGYLMSYANNRPVWWFPRRGRWVGRYGEPFTPPPGLKAAVLAVLVARLAEARQG